MVCGMLGGSEAYKSNKLGEVLLASEKSNGPVVNKCRGAVLRWRDTQLLFFTCHFLWGPLGGAPVDLP
jgi:hypothetical protein